MSSGMGRCWRVAILGQLQQQGSVMRTTVSNGLLSAGFLLAIAGIPALAPAEACAQSTSVTGFRFEQRLEEQLRRLEQQVDRMRESPETGD